MHRIHIAIFSVLYICNFLNAASDASAQTPTFASVAEYTMGQDSQELTVGDFNNDGKADVVVGSTLNNALHLRLGNGDGTFQAEDTSLVEPGSANDVKSADLNGDGKLDLVCAREVADKVAVRLGNGDGTFQADVEYSTGNTPYFITLADVNSNSIIDIVTSNNASNNISVLLGNGDGTFAAATNYPGPSSPGMVQAVRSDNSGVIDIAVTGAGTNVFSVLPGNGDGTFGTKVDYPAGNIPFVFTSGDLRGQGLDDIIIPGNVDPSIELFLAVGDGTYQAGDTVAAGGGPNGAAVADLNSDGKKDLVLSNYDDNTMQLYTGDGAGALTSVGTLAGGAVVKPNFLAVVDLNGDSRLDLVVSKAGAGTGAIDVYLNTTIAAEIDVKGNAVSIASGSTTPSLENNTDFNGAVPNSGQVAKSFQIENSGDYELALLGTPVIEISGTNAADFTANQPISPIGLNSASVFNIYFTPTATGLRTATVTIRNTDPDESEYTFAIQGIGVTPPTTHITRKPPKVARVDSGKEKKRVKFEFNSTTPGATFLCKLDKQSYQACTSAKRYSVSPGQHTFKVKAVINGVEDASPAVYRFKVED